MKKNNTKKMPKAGQAGNGTKPHVSGSFAIRSKIAKEAYKRYIGDNSKLSIDTLKEANAFCEGARFQRLHGK